MTTRTIDWAALLVCPRCRGPLAEVEQGFVCERDRRLYPVIDGVPHMTEETSRRWAGAVSEERT